MLSRRKLLQKTPWTREKKDIVDNSLSWVRRNDFKPKPVEDPTLEKLAKLVNLPLAPGMTSLQKKKLQNNITDWLQSNNPNPDLDDPTLLAL